MISTDRLTLRKLIQSDSDDVYKIYSDVETCRYLLHEPWTDQSKVELFEIEFIKDDFGSENGMNFAVVLNDTVIGVLSAWRTEMKKTAEIGFSFNKNYSGYGYATEAAMALLNHLFEDKNMHRVIANYDARNTASARLCERIGMRKEAHFIKDFWNKEEWTDSYIFAVLKKEF